VLRRTALLATAVALLAAPQALAAKAPVKPAVKLPVVALIDSGARASHHEFDYRGKASTVDQFVGWWDFTNEVKGKEVLPARGQVWDTAVANPYDKNGHGSMTASMVGGRGASAQKTPAAAPGTKLAIAKVIDGEGNVVNEAAAIRWATRTVHADIINISIGSVVPVPADLFRDIYDAISEARAAGILVVVANGNGFANAGLIPGDPGWANSSASSPDVLAVGAENSTGLLNSTDPEVAAVYAIKGASNTDDKGYNAAGGTSFGSPYVAGYGAAVLLASRQGGHPLNAAALELFLKKSSTDSLLPPQTEGYGTLNQTNLPTAIANAKAGRIPSRPSPDVSGIYVDSVVGNLRLVWTTL
jgi:hypothetical protein